MLIVDFITSPDFSKEIYDTILEIDYSITNDPLDKSTIDYLVDVKNWLFNKVAYITIPA